MISRTSTLALLINPIVFLFYFPFLSVALVLNELARFVVSKLVHSKFKGKAFLANGEDSFWGYKKTGSTRNVFGWITLPGGKIDSEGISKFCERKIQTFKDKNGQRPFEKFEKILIPTYGYYSWKEDENFNVRNHVRIFDQKVYSSEDIQELVANDLDKDMDETKPQWEIIVFPKHDDGSDQEKVLILVKWLHAYMDGLSFVMLFKTCVGNNFEYTIDPLNFQIPLWKKIMFHMNCIIYGWFSIFLLGLNIITLKPWIFRNSQEVEKDSSPVPRRKNYYWQKSKPIDMDTLKKIRLNSDRSTVPNVLSTAVALAITKILPKDRIVPELFINELLAYLPYPSIKPQNRFAIYPYGISTKSENPLDKLRRCKQDSLKSILGPDTLMFYYTMKIITRLPSFTAPLFLYGSQGSVLMSNLPLSKTKCVVGDGREVLGFGAWTPQPNDLGLTITTLSYNKGIQICACADSTWLSKEELSKIIEQIPVEIDGMANLCQLSISESSVGFCDKITSANENQACKSRFG